MPREESGESMIGLDEEQVLAESEATGAGGEGKKKRRSRGGKKNKKKSAAADEQPAKLDE